MGYLGRRIGLSQDNGDSNPGAAGGAVGGGLLDLFAHGYFERQGDLYNYPGSPPAGLTATGGAISDYTSGSDVYRAHIFTSSGTFNVTAGGNFGDTIDYLVVGGGGGAAAVHGSNGTGGAGGGGLRTNMPACPYAQAAYPVSTTNPYTVIVGAGGGGVLENPSVQPVASQGTQSEFYPTPGGSGSGIYASGGGAGQTREWAPGPVQTGGSGGGGDTYGPANPQYTGGTVASPDGRSPTVQGFAGSAKGPNSGGGGGGAGEAGSTDGQGQGGDGLQILIAESPTVPAPTRTIGADGGYFAGGGGGEYSPGTGTPGYPGGLGGGGSAAARTVDGIRGKVSTGGGGAAGKNNPSTHPADLIGNGGSGIVVVRYQIASIAATAKATGGAISFYGGKTIHAFTGSGTFDTAPNWSAATVDYLIVGGGGAGGSGGSGQYGGGGGGAGAVRIGTTPIGAHPVQTSIQVGAGGAGQIDGRGITGTPSYFGTPITAPGGGGGGGKDPEHVGGPGGSGGGSKFNDSPVSGGPGTGSDYPGSAPDASPSSGWGNAGGAATGGGAGGGGGASSTGNSPPSGYTGGPGGTGIQIPSTFYDPTMSTIGFPGASGTGWIAGGGGGSTYGNPNAGGGGGGGATVGVPALGYAGAGWGQKNYSPGDPSQPLDHGNAKANSGSGGGGNNNGRLSFDGGSGLVLIAYPT